MAVRITPDPAYNEPIWHGINTTHKREIYQFPASQGRGNQYKNLPICVEQLPFSCYSLPWYAQDPSVFVALLPTIQSQQSIIDILAGGRDSLGDRRFALLGLPWLEMHGNPKFLSCARWRNIQIYEHITAGHSTLFIVYKLKLDRAIMEGNVLFNLQISNMVCLIAI